MNATKGIRLTGMTVLVLLLAGPIAVPVYSQPYPNKPVQLVLPYAAGATTDLVGRIVGPKLAVGLGQPFVMDNRPGAGGDIGIEHTARSAPDGYTLVLATNGLSLTPSLSTKPRFDPIKDLAPISMVAQGHFVLLVRNSLPVKNLQELVEYARANPGKLNFGSGGVGAGTHLAGELLKSIGKVDMVHVPYKGAVVAMSEMIGGHIDMVVIGTPSALPLVQAGKVKALAVLSNRRVPSLPDVPTAKESGVDNYVVTSWFGLLAPAGTPREIVARINAEWKKAAALRDTIDSMQNVGAEPLAGSPDELADFLKKDVALWAKVIKEANIPKID